MPRILFIPIFLICFAACTSQKKTTAPTQPSYGDDRTTEVELLNSQTFKLYERTKDSTYGYTVQNPVKVGGKNDGPLNERRFLNGLLGPKYETIEYERVGSCCPFKTPNGLFGDSGLLDKYKVYWQGAKDTLILYFNMYDKGNLKIPVGFNAR